MNQWIDKLFGVLKSRRFKAAVIAVVVILFQDTFQLDQEKADWIAAILMSWIVGDSLNKTGTLSGRKID